MPKQTIDEWAERAVHAEAMLNWIEKHVVSMRSLTPGTRGENTFEVTYYGPIGDYRYVEGVDLRDCIKAVTNGKWLTESCSLNVFEDAYATAHKNFVSNIERAIYDPAFALPYRHECMKHKPEHRDDWTCPECGTAWSFDSGGPGQCWRPAEDENEAMYQARINWRQS